MDQNHGTLLWKTRCTPGGTKTLYSGNSLATPTPVTDGQYIYAHFGDAGTYCLDYAGRVVWSHREPVEPPPYGFSSSPVLWRDLLVVTYDLTTTSFTVALDKLSGQVRWKADRTQLIHASEGGLLEAYSSPMILEHARGPQLVNHAGYYLSGYDLTTGKELWHFHCPDDAPVVTPVFWKDLIIVGGARCFQAVQVKQENDSLTATAWWRAKRSFPDVPSPVVYGDHVYAVTNKGIATCLEASTGKVCWTQRLSGTYDASVVAGDGKLFFCNTEGETTVAAAAPEFRALSRNMVGEPVRASFAISGGRIFIRGERHLFCIGNKP
jgi:outer membrane protein assembly factor BamB